MKLRRSLFWDTDPATIDLIKNARYVIERVLEFGNEDEVRWLFKHYPRAQIKAVLNLPRAQVSPQSRALWERILAL